MDSGSHRLLVPNGEGDGAIAARRPGAQAATSRCLVLLSDAHGERVFPLIDSHATIGRRSDRRVRIDDGRVSGAHAEVFRRAETWFVRDIGSTNGTWVNEAQLEPLVERELRPNDRIDIGHAAAIFFADRVITCGKTQRIEVVPPEPRSAAAGRRDAEAAARDLIRALDRLIPRAAFDASAPWLADEIAAVRALACELRDLTKAIGPKRDADAA